MPTLDLALLLMIVAAVVAVVAERVRLPYTIALVLAGLVVGSLDLFPTVAVSPEVLLVLLIPPLLFESALRLPPDDLRASGWMIGLLAGPGTLVATLAIGGAAAALFHLPARTAFMLGAIAAAIDPVSVIALIREARLNPRLGAVLEAEAVLNDGVAIVLFTIAASPAVTALMPAIGQFVWLVGMGSVVGIVLAVAVSYAVGRTTHPLVEALASLILAGGALVVAGRMGASGVIAVAVAGFIFGSVGQRYVTEAGRETVRTLWDVIAFLANAALFFLIGLRVPGALLARHWDLVAVVVLTALAVRAITVYGVSAVSRMPDARTAGWQAVLVWGGLRGGVAVALVLSLPADTPGRDLVAAAVFGLVIFTLLAQGLTIHGLMRRVGLLAPPAGPSRSSP